MKVSVFQFCDYITRFVTTCLYWRRKSSYLALKSRLQIHPLQITGRNIFNYDIVPSWINVFSGFRLAVNYCTCWQDILELRTIFGCSARDYIFIDWSSTHLKFLKQCGITTCVDGVRLANCMYINSVVIYIGNHSVAI